MRRMILAVCMALGGAAWAETGEQRLADLRAMLPDSAEFDAWLTDTGETPPDFGAMRSHAEPPDPLVAWHGNQPTPIETAAAWEAHRPVLLAKFARWILGSVPPAPGNLEAEILEETATDQGTSREVVLRFGPDHRASLRVELMIPPGDGPFPVFMTQHNHRGWALIAARRGYLACVYAGADALDDTDTFVDAYPEHDWSRLMRRGWAAGRVIDYLERVPQANLEQIALTGHSRNGKLSLMGAAIDERISAVISSSSGAGGILSTRDYSEQHFGEGIENITRRFPDWFHPRFRFFVGREHKLPVDLHQLAALAAPRACLLSIAYNDGVESTWAMQQTYLSAKPVYALYDAADRLDILWRPMGHETWTTTIERYLDWCDAQFGRGEYDFPERLIHPWDWRGWADNDPGAPSPLEMTSRPFVTDAVWTGEAWTARRDALSAAVRTMLGDAPPEIVARQESYGVSPAHVKRLLRRDGAGNGLEKHDLMFGEYINASIYAPSGTEERGEQVPAVLWLHPKSLPIGYGAAYRRGDDAYRTLARAGFAVFAYDQVGHGRRIEEVEGFYQRHPQWSLLGKKLRDARAALDVIAEQPYVDPDRIYVVGYATGAFVALHLAALDDRPAGYALAAGPPPFRLDDDVAETGGLRRWAQRTLLLPRLGHFVGHEDRVPYDVDELIGAMAPRPVLALTPRHDREAPLPLMEQAIAAARQVYAMHDAEDALTHNVPNDYNHFDQTMQGHVTDWLRDVAGLE